MSPEPTAPSLTKSSSDSLPAGGVVDVPIVRLDDIYKSFGRQRVLRGLSLSIQTGHTTAVLGPSGCGKSVLLKHMMALLRPDSGEVWFENARIDERSEPELVPIRRQFGFLFQQGALFDSMSVRQNIEFPLLEHSRLRAADRNERVRRVLSMVGLEDTIDKMPADLSGGQRKRIALARAIVLEPKVILYDEPTTGLDPIRSDVINELIIKLQHALSITSVVVTHDLASAYKVADTFVMLDEGRVAFEGSAEELRNSADPVVQRFLSGRASDEELQAIRDGSSDLAAINGRKENDEHAHERNRT
jgi:phospholipid/cholesterol/gamma-HCH transport system ATP-binding protein